MFDTSGWQETASTLPLNWQLKKLPSTSLPPNCFNVCKLGAVLKISQHCTNLNMLRTCGSSTGLKAVEVERWECNWHSSRISNCYHSSSHQTMFQPIVEKSVSTTSSIRIRSRSHQSTSAAEATIQDSCASSSAKGSISPNYKNRRTLDFRDYTRGVKLDGIKVLWPGLCW